MGKVADRRDALAERPRGAPHATGRASLGALLYLALGPAALFLSAGTWRWTMGWVFVALVLVLTVGSRVFVWRRNPDLLRERGRYGEARDTAPWDRCLMPLVALVGPTAVSIVAGLHHRFDWPGSVPVAVQALAAMALAMAYGLSAWAMVANPFFSAVVRIQGERTHAVVAGGPYRWVRHPAYLGACGGILAAPLMLAAPWALVPALLTVGATVARTALEDRFLCAHLPGYARYARETRYRLLPGVW